jgi:hypothetical protein
MNPVVGLDISKGENQVQAFLDKRKPYRKSFSILHHLGRLGVHYLNFYERLRNGQVKCLEWYCKNSSL